MYNFLDIGPLCYSKVFPILSSAEDEEVLDSVLRDRSHIDETLRLAAEENAGNYAGEKTPGLHIYSCFKPQGPSNSYLSILNDGPSMNEAIPFHIYIHNPYFQI